MNSPSPQPQARLAPETAAGLGASRSVRVPGSRAVCLCEPGPEGKQWQPECTVTQRGSEQRAAERLLGDLQPLNGSPLLQNS